MLGEIKYDGRINFVDHCGCGLSHTHVGYVPQNFFFDRTSPVSVCDFLSAYSNKKPVFLGNKKSRSKVLEMLKKVGARHLIDSRLGELSGGELQRIMLAFSLNPVPDLLILDEPTSSVDQETEKYMIELIDRVSKEKCVLVISHKLETLMSTDMIYVCTQGHLEKLGKSDNVSDIMSNILAEREKYV